MSTHNAYASAAFGELPLDNAIQVQVVQEYSQAPIIGFVATVEIKFSNTNQFKSTAEGGSASLNKKGMTGWGNHWYMLQPGRLVLDVSAVNVRNLRFELGEEDAYRIIDAEGPRNMGRSVQVVSYPNSKYGFSNDPPRYEYMFIPGWQSPMGQAQANVVEIGTLRVDQVVDVIEINHKGLYRPSRIPKRNASGLVDMTIDGDVIGLESRTRLKPVLLGDGSLYVPEDAAGMVIIRYEAEVLRVRLTYACWPLSLLKKVSTKQVEYAEQDPYFFPDLLPLEQEAFSASALSSGWQAVLQRQPPVHVFISERQRPWIKQVVTHQRNGG